MPRPVPPPPPQPSAEETRRAVREVQVVALAALALFLALASTYGPDGFFERYGRSGGQSWNAWKAARLDEAALRDHPTGRVAWLVGSSILRDAFDEAAIDADLARRGSTWRVAKFGQTRGAAGLSAGMARKLPVRAGDLVVHNVAVENLRRDWLDFVGLPADRLSVMLEPADFWAIDEWSLAEKLEQVVAWPRDFHRYHEDHMAGATAWLAALARGRAPRPRRSSFHVRFREGADDGKLARWRALGEASRAWLHAGDLDLSERQFNVRGLARLAAFCEERGAELVLLDVPPRREYQATFMDPSVRARWLAWLAARPSLAHAPQLPEDHFYDMKHPNARGRAVLSAWLVDWLEGGRPRGARAPLDWPAVADAAGGAAPPEAEPDSGEGSGGASSPADRRTDARTPAWKP